MGAAGIEHLRKPALSRRPYQHRDQHRFARSARCLNMAETVSADR
jgi:hypothetical protein